MGCKMNEKGEGNDGGGDGCVMHVICTTTFLTRVSCEVRRGSCIELKYR